MVARVVGEGIVREKCERSAREESGQCERRG